MILANMRQKVGISVVLKHATEGGNKRDFGEHATKGGSKRDFGEHATIGGNKHDL